MARQLLAVIRSPESGKDYAIWLDRGRHVCVEHNVTDAAGRRVYCKGWRFDRRHPKSCKHIRRYLEERTMTR